MQIVFCWLSETFWFVFWLWLLGLTHWLLFWTVLNLENRLSPMKDFYNISASYHKSKHRLPRCLSLCLLGWSLAGHFSLLHGFTGLLKASEGSAPDPSKTIEHPIQDMCCHSNIPTQNLSNNMCANRRLSSALLTLRHNSAKWLGSLRCMSSKAFSRDSSRTWLRLWSSLALAGNFSPSKTMMGLRNKGNQIVCICMCRIEAEMCCI